MHLDVGQIRAERPFHATPDVGAEALAPRFRDLSLAAPVPAPLCFRHAVKLRWICADAAVRSALARRIDRAGPAALLLRDPGEERVFARLDIVAGDLDGL